MHSAYEVHHVVVPVVEELILQVLAVDEVPLAAGILVAPSVALAREVDPLGMPPLVAHEVEITAIDGRGGDKPDELVQRHAAAHHAVVVANHHVPVHLLVDKAEDDGLVAHQRLVVTLGIGNGLLVGTAVGEFPENRGGLPVLVLLLLDGLDPVVGDSHRHAVIEANASILHLASKAWHAAHLLGNSDGMRIHLMDELVGKGEVGDGIGVLVAVVVVVVAAKRLPQAVVVIEHRRDAIEAETVELILLEPELAVAEQEVEHGVLAVVEAQRVPCRVLTLAVAIEVEVVAAVEAPQALHLVLHRVRVHDVHNHRNAARVGIVDEVLELLGGAKAARGGIEARHMIAKGAIIRVLLNCHDLDSVIPVGLDARQDIGAELLVGAHRLLVLSHANVALVDEQRLHIGLELRYLELIFLAGVPHLSREYLGNIVLNHSGGIGGNALALTALPVDRELEQVAMLHAALRQRDFPVAALERAHLVGCALGPVVEVANHENLGGIRSPLAQHPSLLGVMQPVVVISVGKVDE